MADQVIVGADLEPANPIFNTIARGQKQYWRLFVLANAFQYFPTIQSRQTYIEHDDVVFTAARLMQRIDAGTHPIDNQAALA